MFLIVSCASRSLDGMVYWTIRIGNCLRSKRDYPGLGAGRLRQQTSPSIITFGTRMVDGARGQFLQPAWNWSWGDLIRTQWHSPSPIFMFQLQGHVQSDRIWVLLARTKTCQRGWCSKSLMLKQFQSCRRTDKKVFQIQKPNSWSTTTCLKDSRKSLR